MDAQSAVTIDGVRIESPVGLVAGNGSLPLEFIEGARERGLEVVVVAIMGEADQTIESKASHCTWIKVGEVGKIYKTFAEHKVKSAAFAGGVKRVKIFGGIKLDLKAIALMAKLRTSKDDVLLRGIATELEGQGVAIFSPHLLLKDSVPGTGYLTRRRLSHAECDDARHGWDVAAGIGALDVGQTVVAAQTVIVAVEAVEGTDRCIERAAGLAEKGCVVVKRAKPQQDLRLDLPTIGPKTIETMERCRVQALIIEARRCLILERQRVIELADKAGISILAAASAEDIA